MGMGEELKTQRRIVGASPQFQKRGRDAEKHRPLSTKALKGGLPECEGL